MKTRGMKWVVLMPALMAGWASAQTVPPPYEVAVWPGFRSAAISYTFDDNCPNQLAIAVPMFNEYKFALTLFTVINWGPNWSGLQAAAAQGHEIASHTMSHPALDTLTDAQQIAELKNSQDAVNTHIPGRQCRTLAYPMCVEGNPAIIGQYYVAARGCSGVVEGKTPANFLNISSIVCGALGSIKTGAQFMTAANNAARINGWCVYLIHGIDNDGGYSPLPSDTLRVSLDYLAAHRDEFWVTSFGAAVRYIRERNAATLSELVSSPDSLAIVLSDTLNDSLYHDSLTIRRPLPQGWSSCNVSQGGIPISSQIVDIDSTKYVVFDIVPNSGKAWLTKTGATPVRGRTPTGGSSSFGLLQNYPNPFNPTTTVSYEITFAGRVRLRVFNLLGQSVGTLAEGIRQPGTYRAIFDGTGLPSSIYFCEMQFRDEDGTPLATEIRKMILIK